MEVLALSQVMLIFASSIDFPYWIFLIISVFKLLKYNYYIIVCVFVSSLLKFLGLNLSVCWAHLLTFK